MGKIRIYTNESVSVAIAEGLKRRGVDAFSARGTRGYQAGNIRPQFFIGSAIHK